MSLAGAAPLERADSRERLLGSALRLLAARGYPDVGIREVAAATDLTTGAVYHHFGSKEALFRAAIEHFAERAIEEQPAGPAGGATATERLTGIVGWLAGGQEGWQRDLGVVVSTRIRGLPQFAEVYQRLQPAFIRLVRDPIMAGIESGELTVVPPLTAEALAWSLTASFVGTLEMSARDVLGMPLTEALDAQLALFLRGTRP